MRVVAYNILDGGSGRVDLLIQVLLAQQADVIGLVEAEDSQVLHQLAQRLDMDHVMAMGRKHAVALLSRWTIDWSINHTALDESAPQSLLEAHITPGHGPPLVLGILHLLPHAGQADETRRLTEIARTLEIFKPHRDAGRPHLLMGDFNSNSPTQQIDPARCRPRTRRDWEANGGMIPRRVIQMVLDAGYLDTLDVADPQAARTKGSFCTKHPGQRVDYIFSHGIDRSRITSGWIEHTHPADIASDHYPVGAEIDLR